MPVAEICRMTGIGQVTYLLAGKKSAGLLPTGMRRPRQLDERLRAEP